jgi:oxygen-independent coproporphyrinogen-3 oxidase
MKNSSLYLHFPFCRHLCNFCDFYKTKFNGKFSLGEFEAYLAASLPKLNELYQQHQQDFDPLETVYLGGGTPSLWGEEGCDFFQRTIMSFFNFSHVLEWTMEVDPNAWELATLKAWQALGVNRFSVGIQALDNRLLVDLDRAHSAEDGLKLLDTLSTMQVNFSVDFMLGIPNSEGKRDIEAELNQILQFSPKHISLYIYTIPLEHKMSESIPSDDWVAQEYARVERYLSDHAFKHYEVSNYALSHFESQHNWRYWQQQPVLALGPSASGLMVKKSSVATTGVRYKWLSHKAEYQVEYLDNDAMRLERAYTLARTNKGLNLLEWLSNDEMLKFKPEYDQWVSSGWVQPNSYPHCFFTAEGRVILDSLFAKLLPYM